MIQAKANFYQRTKKCRLSSFTRSSETLFESSPAAKVHDRANRRKCPCLTGIAHSDRIVPISFGEDASFASRNETRVDWQTRQGAGSKICLSFLGSKLLDSAYVVASRCAFRSYDWDSTREEKPSSRRVACSGHNKEGNLRSDVFCAPLFSPGQEKWPFELRANQRGLSTRTFGNDVEGSTRMVETRRENWKWSRRAEIPRWRWIIRARQIARNMLMRRTIRIATNRIRYIESSWCAGCDSTFENERWNKIVKYDVSFSRKSKLKIYQVVFSPFC